MIDNYSGTAAFGIDSGTIPAEIDTLVWQMATLMATEGRFFASKLPTPEELVVFLDESLFSLVLRRSRELLEDFSKSVKQELLPR